MQRCDRLKLAVIGDGGWGTALATVLASNDLPVALWSHDCAYAEEVALSRCNRKFLAGVALSETIDVTARADAAADAAMIVVAVPTIYLRSVLDGFKGKVPPGAIITSVVKGVEQKTYLRPSEIIAEFFPDNPRAVLSGPSHAEEVAKGLPTTVVCASEDGEVARRVQETFSTSRFRTYTSGDVVGVELGGALKNVIGLAAGICEGLGFGDNSRAALLTRGLAEMTRLGVALGADAATFRGLSGMGDLITTCVSPFGRNRSVGLQIAQGKTLDEITAKTEMVAEGVHTTRAVVDLAEKLNIEMPITREVFHVLFEKKNPRQAVADLMSRDPREEKEDFG